MIQRGRDVLVRLQQRQTEGAGGKRHFHIRVAPHQAFQLLGEILLPGLFAAVHRLHDDMPQLFLHDGFEQIFPHAQFHCTFCIIELCVTADDHRLGLHAVADHIFHKVQPALSGHTDIGEHQIERNAGEQQAGRLGVLGFIHFAGALAQYLRDLLDQSLAGIYFVVNYQNVHVLPPPVSYVGRVS